MSTDVMTLAKALRKLGCAIHYSDGEVWLDTEIGKYDGLCIGCAGDHDANLDDSDDVAALKNAEATLTAALEVVQALLRAADDGEDA